ncbi:MAG: DUF1361 domain-containing protein [Flavobacteriales bacterium]|nr:DUF1361 domain-containing protein [Flavobacteriales bacterium]
MIFWLAFLPNSPYIITDMVHLRPRAATYLWLDVITIMSFAWSGLILGFISLRDVQEVISKQTSKFWGWTTVIIALGASSFGVYLGRYLRWNSWDMLSNPLALLIDISILLFIPMDNKNMVAMTVCFSAFLFVAYLTLTNLHRRDDLKVRA